MSTGLWESYFSMNALARRDIPWELGPDLPDDEARFLIPSIQEFQVGESSDGARLRSAAASWAMQHHDGGLMRVFELFIAEEQRHAAELARFLTLNGRGTRGRTSGDLAFRVLRHLTGGLEVSLSVLMTAEIIGYFYYRSLRLVTCSRVLGAICETFVRDESAHLMFHTDQLMRLRRRRSAFGMWITRSLSAGLMRGACGVVWIRHRRVLEGGRLTFWTFLDHCLVRLSLATRAAGRMDFVVCDQSRSLRSANEDLAESRSPT